MHAASVNSEPGSNSPLNWCRRFRRGWSAATSAITSPMEGIDSIYSILYFSPIFQALGATKPLGARKTPNSFNPLYLRGEIEQGAHSLAKKISKNKTPLPSALVLADQAAAGESVATIPSASVSRQHSSTFRARSCDRRSLGGSDEMVHERARACQLLFFEKSSYARRHVRLVARGA